MKSFFKAYPVILIILIFPICSYAQSLHYDAGMQALNNSRYVDAVNELKTAVYEDPNNIEYRFYYAVALYHSDKMTESRSEFGMIAQAAKDSPWGAAAMSYIEAIDLGIYAPQPEKDLEGSLSVAYEDDDNITYSPALVADGADNRSTGRLLISYKPALYSYKPMLLSCSGFTSTYSKNGKYNEDGGSADIALYAPVILGSYLSFSYGKAQVRLKSKPYYTSDYSDVRLTFNAFGDRIAWTSVYLGANTTYYDPSSYEAYDSHNPSFGIKQYLNSLTYLQYESILSDTRADALASRSDEFSMSFLVPFPFMSKLSILQKAVNKSFLNNDPIGDSIRRDNAYILDLTFTKVIKRNFSTDVRYMFTNYRSTLDHDETALGYGSYIDHVLSLSFSCRF